MRKQPKLYPLVPALFVLAICVYLVWSASTLYGYTRSTDSENSLILSVIITLGNTVPIFLALLFLTRLSWLTYQKQKQVLATWQKNKQTVARIAVDLDAYDVTFLTIPENRKTAELRKVYRQLHQLCFELIHRQSSIEALRPGSADFRSKVHGYSEEVEHLSNLANTIMVSGNYYGPAQNIRTVFDVLMRPIELRSKEILFFIEDIPGTAIPPELVSQFKIFFNNLRTVVTLSYGSLNESKTQLDALLARWTTAESNLAQAAQSLVRYLGNRSVDETLEEKTWVLSDAQQGTSLHLLRRALGLPTTSGMVAEAPLEEAAELAYMHCNQDWRPRSQRPGFTGRMTITEAIRVRKYLASQDDKTFKARVFSARFDALVQVLVPRPRFGIFTKIILTLGSIAAGLLALLSFAIIASGADDLVVMGASTFFMLRYYLTSALTLAVIWAIPLVIFLLLRAILLYLLSGSYLLAGEQKRRLSALNKRLAQLLLSFETTRLEVLAAQNLPSVRAQSGAQNKHLSAELIERRLSLPLRGIDYYRALPRASREGIEGKNLLTTIELEIGMLTDEYHEAREAADTALEA